MLLELLEYFSKVEFHLSENKSVETWQKAGVRAEASSKEFILPIQFEKKHVGQALIPVSLFP